MNKVHPLHPIQMQIQIQIQIQIQVEVLSFLLLMMTLPVVIRMLRRVQGMRTVGQKVTCLA